MVMANGLGLEEELIWLRLTPSAIGDSFSSSCVGGAKEVDVDEVSAKRELTALIQKEAASPGMQGLSIDLSGMHLGGDVASPPSPLGLGAMLRCLRRCSSLAPARRLELSRCGLRDADAAKIATFVRRQAPSLLELSLCDNMITARGLTMLCASFARPSHEEVGAVVGSRHARARATVCPPCWLDLRGNAIAQPREVISWLQEMGVHTCNAARCSRLRCVARAPVHLAYGLGKQRDAVLVSHDDLRATFTLVNELRGGAMDAEPAHGSRGTGRSRSLSSSSSSSAPDQVNPTLPGPADMIQQRHGRSSVRQSDELVQFPNLPALLAAEKSPLAEERGSRDDLLAQLLPGVRDGDTASWAQEGCPVAIAGEHYRVFAAPPLAVLGLRSIQVISSSGDKMWVPLDSVTFLQGEGDMADLNSR